MEGGTVLATIETDCEIGSLLSSLQFGNAKVQHDEEATEGGDGDTAKTTTRRTTKRTASAAPAPTGDGSKSATPSRRR